MEEMDENAILKLKLNSKTPGEETINDIWENLIKQTKENQKWISKKLGKDVDSFCVLRIGLFMLKYQKI